MVEAPGFDPFYRAVHNGREPFPWQVRLADQVDSTGWPAEIGVPTGLGKTSCLDIAVWALARQAGRAPTERTAPTRTWYVVNRRLLVDAAYDHGCRLQALLANPAGDEAREAAPASRQVLLAVADALTSIRGGAGAVPLYVTRLRGGADLGARPPDPSQPAVIFATVPMFASRLLFRGYGTSTSMRPVDAALAGVDSLVLLDEAHLARPLRDLAGPLAECDPGNPEIVLPGQRSRPALVSLTATGDVKDAFVLDDADKAHPVVRQRLDAAKPVRLVETREKALVGQVVSETAALLAGRHPSATVVFLNRPATARAVFEHMTAPEGKQAPVLDADVELLTGRIRDREGDALRARLLDPVLGAPAGRPDRMGRDRHLVVIATQTLEVGADLDFDFLVTEACGARALVQRLGRLNRLGQVDDAAATLVFARDAKGFGIYRDEPRAVWERLRAAAADNTVDLSPRRAGDVLGPPEDAPDRVGELLPAHVWEWVKTTTAPEGEAPPELFFAGFDRDLARVTLSWRVVVPDDGCELRPPVSAAEAVDVPLWEAREALAAITGGNVARLGPDRVTIEQEVSVARLRPGDHVVVPAGAGGYDGHGWAPESKEPVFDVSLLRPPGLPLIAGALTSLIAPGEEREAMVQLAARLTDPPEPGEEAERADLARDLRDCLVVAGPNEAVDSKEWAALVDGLLPEVAYPLDGPGYLIRRSPRRNNEPKLRSDVFDELSFTATSAALVEHLGSVGELAGRMAEALGFDAGLVEAATVAGRYHDLGKLDVRFQRWLNPLAGATEPVAKSSRPWFQWQRDRRAAGWPQGGRHEELSRRLVKAWLKGREGTWDAELVLHLVVSHHGFGRPLVTGVADPTPVAVSADIEGTRVSASGDLAEVDWEQPARFRRCCEQYGYWGLALMEAVLRQADHQASAVVVA